jgi:N-carbamoyl-L-amino-acid hydrolase
MAALDLTHASALARELFAALEARSRDEPGVTRIPYAEGERMAYALVAAAAREWNAEHRFDSAGNQFLTLPGADRSRMIQVGSHLDTVPHGGNYDGAAGVLAGIALQAALAGAARQPPFDLTVTCLRAEESCWFPHSYIGSKTALGRLDPDVLDNVRRSDSGRSLAEHMRDEGFDPDAVRRGTKLFEPERIVAYIEPHIEQGPLLVSENVPLGIITGIRGSFRYRNARALGEYAHSGATPHHNRRDAVLATSRLVVAMEALWDEFEPSGEDLTVTFGEIGTDPSQHSFSKIAGDVRFCVDVRSRSPDTLRRVREKLHTIAAEIASGAGVSFEFGALTGTEPTQMSGALNGMAADACRQAAVPVRHMVSGGGHDAATYAAAGIPATMLFIRNENGSHNPDEHMDFSDFDRAIAVLATMMEEPAERWLALRKASSDQTRAAVL